MQAIYILTGVDTGDNAMLVDASRKRQLHKDAVDVPSGVQLLNQIDQIFFASILVKYVLLAVKAAFTTILDFSGKRAVVIGRSDIVGVPMAFMLQHANATVTVCHSYTKELSEITRQADILVSAVGKLGTVTSEMVKPGAVVIDVGITRGFDGKLHGDVDFDSVKDVVSHITPIPGGVGPMTRAMLMNNIWTICHEPGRK